MDRVVHVRVAAGELRALAEIAAKLEVPLVDVAAWGAEATCAVPLLNVPDWERCRARIEETLRGAVTLEAGCGVVSVVGDGLTGAARALPRFLAALDESRAAAKALHAGPLRIAATIDGARLADAQRGLHAAFVSASH
jgi:aspartokinase